MFFGDIFYLECDTKRNTYKKRRYFLSAIPLKGILRNPFDYETFRMVYYETSSTMKPRKGLIRNLFDYETRKWLDAKPMRLLNPNKVS